MHHGLVILIFLISLLVALAIAVFWVWTLIDCLTNKRLTEAQKVLWVVMIFLFGVIASLAYVFAGRSPKVYIPPQQYQGEPQALHQSGIERVPAQYYRPYQEGYSVQAQLPSNPSRAAPSPTNEEQSVQQQVEYEQMQISYPE